MFRSSHFSFLVLVTFGDEVTKIQKYYVTFVYILQGKMGKTEKKERKSRNWSDQNTAETYFVYHISPIFQISLTYAFIGCP